MKKATMCAIRKHRTAIAVIVALAVAAVLVAAGLLICSYQQQAADRRSQIVQARQAVYSDRPSYLREALNLEWSTDPSGEEVPRANLEPSAGLFEELLESYNADPSTDVPLTLDELEWQLGDGLLDTLGDGRARYTAPAALFLDWCEAPADLVYNQESVARNYTPGETANPKGTISNFGFVKGGSEDYPNYQFRWEYEAESGGPAPEGGE